MFQQQFSNLELYLFLKKIFIKNWDILSVAHLITAIVLDKTGCLTSGRMCVDTCLFDKKIIECNALGLKEKQKNDDVLNLNGEQKQTYKRLMR